MDSIEFDLLDSGTDLGKVKQYLLWFTNSFAAPREITMKPEKIVGGEHYTLALTQNYVTEQMAGPFVEEW